MKISKITEGAGPGCLSPGRHQRGDVLPMEEQARSTCEASELRRVSELEAENAKLKPMYAELALDNAAMKDLIATEL